MRRVDYGPGGELELAPELSPELAPELGVEVVPGVLVLGLVVPGVVAPGAVVPELGPNVELWPELGVKLELELDIAAPLLPGSPEEQVVLLPEQAPEQHVLQAGLLCTSIPPATHASETQNRALACPS